LLLGRWLRIGPLFGFIRQFEEVTSAFVYKYVQFGIAKRSHRDLMLLKSMHDTIVKAIENQTVLALTYKGIAREVEPHAYGRGTSGNDLLRCYQVAGGHTSDKPHTWDLLIVNEISALSDTGCKFAGARPEYRRNDKAMSTIYAQL
jgi:hypothetical protein